MHSNSSEVNLIHQMCQAHLRKKHLACRHRIPIRVCTQGQNLVIIVSADVLAHNGARPSTDTAVNKYFPRSSSVFQ